MFLIPEMSCASSPSRESPCKHASSMHGRSGGPNAKQGACSLSRCQYLCGYNACKPRCLHFVSGMCSNLLFGLVFAAISSVEALVQHERLEGQAARPMHHLMLSASSQIPAFWSPPSLIMDLILRGVLRRTLAYWCLALHGV